ncbi:MAG: DUF4252 domain-containing protein [Bacteroidetes bacterium]|nr:DUF4252 domain-containing protein [Bacteroidota bacterium]
MKKIISVILVVLIYTSCMASNEKKDYPSFYKLYKGSENVVNFRLPTDLMAMFINKKDDKELKQFLKDIDNLTFFIAEDSANALLPMLYEYLPSEMYKDVMIIADSSSDIIFKARDDGNSISEIIMLIEESNSFIVMSIEGDFTEKDIKKFVKAIDTNKVRNTSSE